MARPTLNELSQKGRFAYSLPKGSVPRYDLAKDTDYMREQIAKLPEISELQLMRHYTNLSHDNFGVETGFYPLGSCTMKYNPKLNEVVAALDGFANIHPLQHHDTVQGALELLYRVQADLATLSGMDAITLQPAAGAHGEWTGLNLIRAYHEKNGDDKRVNMLVPDSAHGTNPASAQIAGFKVIKVKSNEDGLVDLEDLRRLSDDKTAGIMLTNPNTLGLFESDIKEIASIVHEAGGLLYYDGANLNAIMGKTTPGRMGFDVVHMNVHKTLSTPHGGGGPGAGPVGVKAFLKEFLPSPTVAKEADRYFLDYNHPDSIGHIIGYLGNFSVYVKTYAYIRSMGGKGLRKATEAAVLHANYLRKRLEPYFDTPYPRICKHEFVLSGNRQKKQGAKTMDIAKRLLDEGFYAPTVYFPLIVEEALMIEPTDTENIEMLDAFADTMIQIAKDAESNPDLVTQAPLRLPVKRLDEAGAARHVKTQMDPIAYD